MHALYNLPFSLYFFLIFSNFSLCFCLSYNLFLSTTYRVCQVNINNCFMPFFLPKRQAYACNLGCIAAFVYSQLVYKIIVQFSDFNLPKSWKRYLALIAIHAGHNNTDISKWLKVNWNFVWRVQHELEASNYNYKATAAQKDLGRHLDCKITLLRSLAWTA